MRLQNWMRTHGKTDASFGQLVGATHHAVGKWRRGERIPIKEFMSKIRSVTNGEVTANDFHERVAA